MTTSTYLIIFICVSIPTIISSFFVSLKVFKEEEKEKKEKEKRE